jgi:hypothetical protein
LEVRLILERRTKCPEETEQDQQGKARARVEEKDMGAGAEEDKEVVSEQVLVGSVFVLSAVILFPTSREFPVSRSDALHVAHQ